VPVVLQRILKGERKGEGAWGLQKATRETTIRRRLEGLPRVDYTGRSASQFTLYLYTK